MTRHPVRVLSAALAAVVSLMSVSAQTPAAPDAARLRSLFFQRDYETALIEGAKLPGKNATPGTAASAEANAWYILNKVRAGDEAEGVTAARLMVSSAPASGWSWLALAGALNYQGEIVDEAIEAGAKAFQLMPDNADAIWIHAVTLSKEEKRLPEAIAFLDSRRARVANPAELLATKAYALYLQSDGRTPNEEKFKAALETYAEARRADPTNVNAHYQPGTFLNQKRRTDEALPLLKAAVDLAPGSSSLRQAYWRALNSSQTLTAEQKSSQIQADMAAYQQKHGNRPGAMYAVSSMLGDLKLTDRQRELEDRVLKEFPESTSSEWILAYRWRAIAEEKDGSKRPEYRRLLTEFLKRPVFHIEGLRGEAYRDLFSVLVEDPATQPAELKSVLDGMIKYETTNVHITYGSALVSLADHKMLLPEAEALARQSESVLRQKVESRREMYAELGRGEGEYEKSMNWMTSMGCDALGWVLFKQNKIDEAERELLRSYDLNHESRVNLHHLGQLYEAKEDVPKAEQYYIKGLAAQAPGPNPCEAALKTLYEKKHSAGGGSFEKYLADIRDADRIKRHETILKDRVAAPAAPAAFNLKTLDGKRVSLDSLKGKIVAINFWGIWCGWCIQELPDYQKLHEKYKDDPDVVILTIDNDQNPDDVPPWMKQKGYTFPVLLDDGYVAKSGITAFPTTWFLDREGRRVFVKVGWSEKLLEEFSWRLEAIRK